MADLVPVLGRAVSPATSQVSNLGIQKLTLGDGYTNYTTTGTVDRLRVMTVVYDFVSEADSTTLLDFLLAHRGTVVEVPYYIDDFSNVETGLFVNESITQKASPNPSTYQITIVYNEVPQ